MEFTFDPHYSYGLYHMGHDLTKPVLGASEKARLK